ncbi:MAG: hypothetical protein NTY86_01915, partial [Deltaproteobacteria bacterium]|nr:hypothetical protein [Deltaproteobacteria bacterium]
MIKKYFLFVLMLFMLLNSGSTAVAKERKATSENKSMATKEKIDNSPLIPFDINTEKLPPNFTGTDIIKLYTILLKKAPLKKDEFETTADYEKKSMVAVADTDDVYAFKLDPHMNLRSGVTVYPYNADAQNLQIDIETSPLSKYTFQDYRSSMIIKHVAGTSKSHMGSNAFGAKVLVTSLTGKQYGIALTNQKDFGTSRYDGSSVETTLMSNRTISLIIEIPPDKAKILKNKIGVLLLCKTRLYKLKEDTTPSTENSRGPAKRKPPKLSNGNGLI